jgi:hypothetical protein
MDWHLFFNPLNISDQDLPDEPSLPHSSILLSPFAIREDLNIGGILLSKSEQIQLAGGLSIANLSHVSATSISLPSWLDTAPYCHFMAEALAISLTFITGYRFGFASKLPSHISFGQLTDLISNKPPQT